MAGKSKTNKRKGVRGFFSRPKKGCRTYGGKKNWRYATHSKHVEPSCSQSIETSHTVTPMEVVCDNNCIQEDESRKQQLTVLSLFDGISSGYYAISRRLGIDVANYFSSEIDKDALEVQQVHFFKEITPVGDVTHLSQHCLKKMGRIDLLIAGSPCNTISKANPLRKKLNDPDGTGILFFEFIRIRNILQAQAKCLDHSLFWMFENGTNIDAPTLNELNRLLGCSPIKMISNSSTRARYFWGNIPGMQEKNMDIRENFIPFQYYLKPFRSGRIDILPTITTCSNGTKKKGMHGDDALVFQNGEPSFPEIEKSFNFPEHFIDVANFSATQRLRLMGKSWDVDLLEDLFEPLCKLFKKKINTVL